MITKLQSVNSNRLGKAEGSGVGECMDLPGRGKQNRFYWHTGGWVRMSFRGPGTGEDGCSETQGERPLELGTFGIV